MQRKAEWCISEKAFCSQLRVVSNGGLQFLQFYPNYASPFKFAGPVTCVPLISCCSWPIKKVFIDFKPGNIIKIETEGFVYILVFIIYKP